MKSAHRFREATGLPLTLHAARRIASRRLSAAAVTAALDFGRTVHVRGAEIYAIGRREVAELSHAGIDLARFEGVQVVCGAEGSIITVYRNRNLRGLRRDGGRGRAA